MEDGLVVVRQLRKQLSEAWRINEQLLTRVDQLTRAMRKTGAVLPAEDEVWASWDDVFARTDSRNHATSADMGQSGVPGGVRVFHWPSQGAEQTSAGQEGSESDLETPVRDDRDSGVSGDFSTHSHRPEPVPRDSRHPKRWPSGFASGPYTIDRRLQDSSESDISEPEVGVAAGVAAEIAAGVATEAAASEDAAAEEVTARTKVMSGEADTEQSLAAASQSPSAISSPTQTDRDSSGTADVVGQKRTAQKAGLPASFGDAPFFRSLSHVVASDRREKGRPTSGSTGSRPGSRRSLRKVYSIIEQPSDVSGTVNADPRADISDVPKRLTRQSFQV